MQPGHVIIFVRGNDSFWSRVESGDRSFFFFFLWDQIRSTRRFSRFCLYLVLQDLSGWRSPSWSLTLAPPFPFPIHPLPWQGKVKYVNRVEEMLNAYTWRARHQNTSQIAATTTTRVLYTWTPARRARRQSVLSSWGESERRGNQGNRRLRSSSSPRTWCWPWLSWLRTTEHDTGPVSHVFICVGQVEMNE